MGQSAKRKSTGNDAATGAKASRKEATDLDYTAASTSVRSGRELSDSFPGSALSPFRYF
jgi:hypothetical protein